MYPYNLVFPSNIQSIEFLLISVVSSSLVNEDSSVTVLTLKINFFLFAVSISITSLDEGLKDLFFIIYAI